MPIVTTNFIISMGLGTPEGAELMKHEEICGISDKHIPQGDTDVLGLYCAVRVCKLLPRSVSSAKVRYVLPRNLYVPHTDNRDRYVCAGILVLAV